MTSLELEDGDGWWPAGGLVCPCHGDKSVLIEVALPRHLVINTRWWWGEGRWVWWWCSFMVLWSSTHYDACRYFERYSERRYFEPLPSNQCSGVTNILPVLCLAEHISGVVVVRFLATRRPFSDVAIVRWHCKRTTGGYSSLKPLFHWNYLYKYI